MGQLRPSNDLLQSIFGYLVICIIYKWSTDWTKASTPPPSLLSMLISMFLSPGTVEPESQLYRGQSVVQVILLLVAFVCVPWLLCVKPYFVWQELKKTQVQGYVELGHGDDAPRDSTDDALEGEEEGNGRAIVEDREGEPVRT